MACRLLTEEMGSYSHASHAERASFAATMPLLLAGDVPDEVGTRIACTILHLLLSNDRLRLLLRGEIQDSNRHNLLCLLPYFQDRPSSPEQATSVPRRPTIHNLSKDFLKSATRRC